MRRGEPLESSSLPLTPRHLQLTLPWRLDTIRLTNSKVSEGSRGSISEGCGHHSSSNKIGKASGNSSSSRNSRGLAPHAAKTSGAVETCSSLMLMLHEGQHVAPSALRSPWSR